MKTILVVVGTRPDAIKLVPLYQALQKESCRVLLCATFQHDDLLQQVFNLFGVVPDIRLNVMRKDQDLAYLTATIIEKMSDVIHNHKPSLVLVQGDTATAFASSLAAYYLKVPIGHIEAGLRTGDKRAPFPEESYRCFISMVADFHFAATNLNVANLLAERVARQAIFYTGNTVVDALIAIKKSLDLGQVLVDPVVSAVVQQAQQQKKQLVVLTAHRREAFDGGLKRIFATVRQFAQQHQDVIFYFPVHPNSNVHKAIQETALYESTNVIFASPSAYHDLVYLLVNAHWIMTDSGGIQEEAISLGKRVIILRDTTERIEGVWEGLALLAGTQEAVITKAMLSCYDAQLSPVITFNNIYGDGQACNKIVNIIRQYLLEKTVPQDFIERSKSQLHVI